MNKTLEPQVLDAAAATEDAIALIGNRIREIRTGKGMKLQDLAESAGLSVSMLSLVERGKTSPSISTIICICSALDVHMGDLLAPAGRGKSDPVSRRETQASYRTAEGVLRRILMDDRLNGVELAVNEYVAKSGSGPTPVHHQGFEYGVVLEGELTVELDGETHRLKAGDLIAYDSSRDHRIWNYSGRKVRALWINLHRR
ncbi:MAG: helix-turn-helix domain-containing protein [Parvibaculaceae bacterium]